MVIVLMETSPSVDGCNDPIMALEAVANGKSFFTPVVEPTPITDPEQYA